MKLFGGICQFLVILISSSVHFLDGRQVLGLTVDKEDRAVTSLQMDRTAADCQRPVPRICWRRGAPGNEKI